MQSGKKMNVGFSEIVPNYTIPLSNGITDLFGKETQETNF